MLQKRTLKRDRLANYSQSFSNLHKSPFPNLDLKEFCLKKSVFNPPEQLAESLASRRHIRGTEVPLIDVVHHSKRWLLIQSPRFSKSFFKRLNCHKLGNPYEQLLKIFKNFATLTSIYGFFRTTPGMIIIEHRTVRVWINQDVFSDTRMLPLSEGLMGQRQFVIGFLRMMQQQVRQWQYVSNIHTIHETVKLLDWRSKINRGSFTAIKASKEVFYPPNESHVSFQPNQLGDGRRLLACRSVQEIEIYQQVQRFKPGLSNSVHVKEWERKRTEKSGEKMKIFGLFTDSKDLKYSFNDNKGVEVSNEIRRTKKKFNLASTSSTLQRFSEKWRLTVGKKMKRVGQGQQSNQNEQERATPSHINHQNSQTLSIQHQFEGLFHEDEPRTLKFAEQAGGQSLQKIAEQMEEVLIW